MKNRPALPSRKPSQQRGIALVVGLLMLVILAIISISAISTTTLDESMAGNMRDRELAFQAAESALRHAESQLAVLPFSCGHADVAPPAASYIDVVAADSSTLRIWDRAASGTPDPWDDDSWVHATAYNNDLMGVAEQPRYVVEQLTYDATDNSAVYRVTARGVGSSPVSRSVVQSHFRKVFRPVLNITGTSGDDVVALGERLLELSLNAGALDIDLSFQGWDPTSCAGLGDDITVYFNGNGGQDTFLIADVADVSRTDITGQVLRDVTNDVHGLLEALTNFKVKQVGVDNSGSTVITILNSALLSQTSIDNEYCINTNSAPTPQSILNGQIGALVGTITGLPVLTTLLNLVTGLTDPLVGPSGLIPILPENAALIIDGAGDDSYEIYSDTSASTFIIADLAGDDTYTMQGTGSGLLNAPIVLDTDGSAAFDVDAGNYLPLNIDLGVITDLNGLLSNPLISTVLNILATPLNCGVLDLVCKTTKLATDALLGDILAEVGNLFGGTPINTGGTPSSFVEGRCAPDWDERLSWRELRQS